MNLEYLLLQLAGLHVLHMYMYLRVSWCCRSERVAGRKSGVTVETLISLSLICLERPIHWSMINSQPALQLWWERKLLIIFTSYYGFSDSPKFDIFNMLHVRSAL